MTTADQWLATAPAHWTRGRLKNLIAVATNGTWGSDPVEDDTDVRCVRAADFDRVTRRADLSKAPLRYVEPSSLRQHLLSNGDLVLEKSGGGEKQPVGMAVLFTGIDKAVCSNFCARIKPSIDVDPRFLTYVFAAAYGQGLTQAAIKQTTGIQNLDTGAFFASRWAYPAAEEQRRIADFLDAETALIDRLLRARQRHIGLVEERWESSIYQELIQSGAPEIELRRLGVEVTTGPFGTVFSASEYQEGGIPMVNPLHIRNGEITPDFHHAVAPETAARLTRHRLRSGDLIVGRKGDLGRAALVQASQDGWVCGSDCIALHPGEGIRSHFLDYVLRSQYIRSQLLARSLAATMPSLNEGNLLSLRIPCLTLNEQDSISSRLDLAHDWLVRARHSMRRQVTLLRERRQVLITAAVTGQFDVSTASGRNVTEGVAL